METQLSSNNTVTDEPLLQLRHELAQTWGIDSHRIRALICQLTDDHWHTISDLIAINAISHWNVAHLLQRLQPWTESKGDQVRIRSACAAMVRSTFDCSKVSSASTMTPYEVATKAGEEAARLDTMLASMTQIVKELPINPVRHLDHVSATPLTCVKRAQFLARNYDLEGAKILLLGDHDLTSIALALVCPNVEITLVDLDERILSYINTTSTQHGWTIRTIFADFRIELPRSLSESFDLVFTDPPYTPDGIHLFLSRGIESLKDASYARLLFCYGFSERHPGLGFKVQSVLYELRLVTEAILPQFNRYFGAETIASSAALYICRPTRRSLPAAEAQKVNPRIYTQGKSAEETALDVLPTEVVDKVKQHIAEFPSEKLTLVGDGWPKGIAVGAEMTSLRGYLRTMYAMVGTPSKPYSIRSPHAGLVAIDLYPHYDAYFARVPLISAARHLIIVAADNIIRTVLSAERNDLLRILLESKYHVLSIDRASTGRPAIVMLEQIPLTESDGVNYVLRYIIDHRHAKLANAWREALISWFDRQNRAISKNEARQEIDSYRLATIHASSYLPELSLGDLKLLVASVTQSLEHLSTQG